MVTGHLHGRIPAIYRPSGHESRPSRQKNLLEPGTVAHNMVYFMHCLTRKIPWRGVLGQLKRLLVGKESIMNREDWTLLAVASAEGEPLSPVQLQKSLFIIGEKLAHFIGDTSFYDFVPYNYGPFDPVVYEDAVSLEREKFVTIRKAPEQRWNEYSATREGLERAQELRIGLSEEVLNYIDLVVNWTRELSFDDLIRAIYKEFPESRRNSVFQH